MKNKVGSPVKGNDFYGRDLEIAEISDLIARGHVLMLAPRRVGKTSILFRLRDQPTDGWKCLFFSAEALTSEAQFVAAFLETVWKLAPPSTWKLKISHRLQQFIHGLGGVDVGFLRVRLADAIQGTWQEDGATAVQILDSSESKTLVLIDEFPIFVRRLLEQPDGRQRTSLFLDWFRDLRIARDLDNVRFLVTGSIGLDGVVHLPGLTATINDFAPYRLGPWSLELADQFLARLGEEESLPLAPEIRSSILSRINWPIPFHLQLFFDQIRRSRAAEISLQRVEDAYKSLLESQNRLHFEHWAERLEAVYSSAPEHDLARAILRAAALAPVGITKDTVVQLRQKYAPRVRETTILATLENDGYLTFQDSHWVFASFLLRDWWIRWKTDFDDLAESRHHGRKSAPL
jgi:hypothetical protein